VWKCSQGIIASLIEGWKWKGKQRRKAGHVIVSVGVEVDKAKEADEEKKIGATTRAQDEAGLSGLSWGSTKTADLALRGSAVADEKDKISKPACAWVGAWCFWR
jgi:hypothetical protein